MTNEPRTRRLIGLSVGVSDEALKRIGLVMVLGAGLDHRRMSLLNRADDVPILESAKWSRKDLTRAIERAYSRPPYTRLSDRVEAWQSEVLDLLAIRDRYAHSVTYYEVRGDGQVGSFSHHPKTGANTAVVDEPRLDDEVLRFSEAGQLGAALDIETTILRQGGPPAHDAHLRAVREYERSVDEMLRDPPDS